MRARRRHAGHGLHPRLRDRHLLHDVPALPGGEEGARVGVRHDALHAARRRGAGRGVQAAHPSRAAPPLGGRRFLLGGGRVPRRVRQRADGADRQGHLRGPDAGAVREGARRLRQGQAAQARLADRPAGVLSRGRADDAQGLRQGRESRGPRRRGAAGQGPHLHEPLRLPGLAARRRQGARRLGRHQGADRQGPRLDHQRGQELGPARPRRRRLPDRPQVVVHAQERSAARPIS